MTKRTPAKTSAKAEESSVTEEIDSLMHNRGTALRVISRIKDTITVARMEQTELTLAQIKVYKSNAENAHSNFMKWHQEIITKLPSDKRQEQDQQHISFCDLYDEVAIHLQTCMENINAFTAPQLHNIQQPVVVQQPLPRVVPTFDGQFENWEKFKVMFKDIIDRSNELPRIKLYHLEKALIGDAAGLIDAKTISDGNYEYAWKILEERYADKRRLIDRHLEGILEVKRMVNENHIELQGIIEKFDSHIENLKHLGQELTGVSESLVVFLISRALDGNTRKLWESTMKKGELPTYHRTIIFLKEHASVLERCRKSTTHSEPQRATVKSSSLRANAATSTLPTNSCEFCSSKHYSFQCPEFNGLPVKQRHEKVKQQNVCFNCLRSGHRATNCPSKKTCSKCQRKHHTLLHQEGHITTFETPQDNTPVNASHSRVPVKPQLQTSQVLLLTALVDIIDRDEHPHQCRALIDSGSQVSFITKSMATDLNIQVEEVNIPISGIGSTRTTLKEKAIVQVRSKCRDYSFFLHCLVAQQITGHIPGKSINIECWEIPPGIDLADPLFHQSGPIDLLIGMDHFYELLKPGYLKISENLPDMHDSKLGWLLGGKFIENAYPSTVLQSHVVHSDPLGDLIQKFWETESIHPETETTSEEEMCEQNFQTTHRRDVSGRYIVELPLKNNNIQFPDSRSLALRRFYLLETKLCRQPELKDQYDAFIEEYEALNHCKEIQESEDAPNLRKWYLPHHAVIRPSNSTTKCRVVFDASAKVRGCSLNDCLMTGPTVQSDLLSIVLRFRRYKYVLSADIAKMYRQIIVDHTHTPMQRIFWRKDPNQRLRVLELSTVTYGTASAPFLATRALLQLARDESERFPLASKIIEDDFYVDNTLFGSNNFHEAMEMQRQLCGLLRCGGMHLHKWSSNDSQLLDTVPHDDRDTFISIGDCGANEVIKTLGLMWNPHTDELIFVTQNFENIEHPTKRQVLSVIARIFDPIGLISPVIVSAKIVMQDLWKEQLNWDDELPEPLHERWREFQLSLTAVYEIRIPRSAMCYNAMSYELHGFADASQVAYGACVYIRSVHSNGTASTKLLSSKSKIAPIAPLSIPRMELLAALLLSRLVTKIAKAMKLNFKSITLWSDSQVTLAWIRKPLNNLQVYVRNRVSEINSNDHYEWKYISSSQNPADIVSRGQTVAKLATNNMWWNGPKFLQNATYQFEIPETLLDCDIPELKPTISVHTVMKYAEFNVLTKYESFRKTQRIIAYVLRFITNCRKNRNERTTSLYPTILELRKAMYNIVCAIQSHELSYEIECVKSGENNHRLSSLKPFIQNELLRVGGRIHRASLPYDARHQLILPDKNAITHKLIASIHRENLHIGASGVINIMRQQFWLINAKSTVRKVIRSCVICFKTQPITIDQQMGDLPSYRIHAAPTFQTVGIDFAGPILVKQSTRRAIPVKGYICIFVCMVTKSMHLEAVENLSSEAFLTAFQRFISRRGIPETVYSDNGSNFIGAKAELHELYQMFKRERMQKHIFELCQVKEIEWKTIPPRAPHFGGLWEAGVKSVKSVLKRVYKSTSLTIFEFSTLLCQIEAILNSRPLYAHSSDPTDLEALTPGHLMIDRPLIALPEPSYDEIPTNRLSRWQYVQKLREHFWKRWSKEYVTEMQVRKKWTKQQANVQPGLIVLLKEDVLPPQCWKLGRVIKTYPGADGLVRVVDVKTKSGTYKRPIHKLAPLPIMENSDNSNPTLSGGEYVQSEKRTEKYSFRKPRPL